MSDAQTQENATEKTNKNTTTTDETLTDVSLNCSSLKCMADGGPNQLQCCSCKRWIHYECTKLPPYMLQAFISRRIKRYYYCECCITVPEKLMADFYPQSSDQEEVKRLRREVNRCENLIKIAEENSRMANKLLSKKMNETDECKIEQIIDSKLEKFGLILEQHKVAEKSTYASVANSAPSDFKTIMKMAKVEEITEERDRRSRTNNIIIHGAEEVDSTDEAQNTDQTFVTKFLETLEESDKKPSFFGRIGRKIGTKNRPMKIVFKNESVKKMIFSKLRMLKGKDEYKGVAVTEDLTESERKVVKLWSDKAKDRNANNKDENIIWRVRGSPKDGSIRLKKFSIEPIIHNE